MVNRVEQSKITGDPYSIGSHSISDTLFETAAERFRYTSVDEYFMVTVGGVGSRKDIERRLLTWVLTWNQENPDEKMIIEF